MAQKSLKSKSTPGELLYGIHPVVEVLRAKRRKLISIYTTKPTPKGYDAIEKLMPKYPVPIQYVTREVLTRMVNSTDHQGVVAWVQPFGFRTKMFDPVKHPFLVMLDGIQDPRNTGAILRSAYCTNMSGVILCKKNASPLNATAFKASAGLAEHLEIYQAPSPVAAIQELKDAGYNIYLATFDGKDASQMTFQAPTCMVIGAEGTGISSAIMKSGVKVTLPQREKGISYNASVAAGLLLFLISTQHKKISI